MLPNGLQILLGKKIIGRTACAAALNLVGLLQMKQPKHSVADLADNIRQAWSMSDVKPPESDGAPSTEMILVETLLRYCIRLAGPCGTAGMIPTVARWQITASLRQCRAQRSEDEESVIFWAWVVTLDLWRTPNGQLLAEGLALRDLYVERFAWARSDDVAQRVLESFFCDPRLLKCHEDWVASPGQ